MDHAFRLPVRRQLTADGFLPRLYSLVMIAPLPASTSPATPATALAVYALLQNATILTVFLAFVGYMTSFFSQRVRDRRRDKLRLVNKRLNEFYGPLYVASEAGNIAYRSLLAKLGKSQSYPIRDEELQEWIAWMNTIFFPLNDIREKIIIEKAYLIVEERMPQCLLDFVTHVVGYKAVAAKWNEGDFSERRSSIGWPPEFDIYVRDSYAALKAEQTRLVHSVSWRFFHSLWTLLRGRKVRAQRA